MRENKNERKSNFNISLDLSSPYIVGSIFTVFMVFCILIGYEIYNGNTSILVGTSVAFGALIGWSAAVMSMRLMSKLQRESSESLFQMNAIENQDLMMGHLKMVTESARAMSQLQGTMQKQQSMLPDSNMAVGNWVEVDQDAYEVEN